MSIKFSKNSENENGQFYCSFCDYRCSLKQHWIQHNNTKKHIKCAGNQSKKTGNQTDMVFTCKCGRHYRDRSGLWKHKQKCSLNNNKNSELDLDDNIGENDDSDEELFTLADISDKKLILQLLTQNQELQKTIIELTKNGINNYNSNNSTNINNSNNKTFNLQVFLNETCKNAMNITDFVNSIQPTLEDLENVGRVGYAEGISNIIINNLRKMEITERPIHCSDTKREVTYIKSDDEWNKETEDKPILLKAIKDVANKNIQNIMEWKDMHPGCTSADSRKNDTFLKIVSNSMCGSDTDEITKNFNKIIKNLSKEVAISNIK